MTVLNILSQNIDLEDKKTLLEEINSKKKHLGNQCLYAIQNEVYHNFIKLGCTNDPARRKLDYKTYYPHEYSYNWIIYLEKFDCLIAEDIVKIELDDFNIKEDGGKEFLGTKTVLVF